MGIEDWSLLYSVVYFVQSLQSFINYFVLTVKLPRFRKQLLLLVVHKCSKPYI